MGDISQDITSLLLELQRYSRAIRGRDRLIEGVHGSGPGRF